MKLVNAPIIEEPEHENQLVAMVMPDMTIGIMRLEKFIDLIAASNEAVDVIREAVNLKLDEAAFNAVRKALENRLDELVNNIGDIDAGAKGELAGLKIIVQDNKQNIEKLQANQDIIDKNITEIRDIIGKLDERLKALEGTESDNNGEQNPL